LYSGDTHFQIFTHIILLSHIQVTRKPNPQGTPLWDLSTGISMTGVHKYIYVCITSQTNTRKI